MRQIQMKYDFTSVLDRRGKDAIAIDALGHGTAPGAPKEGFDPIPMWVADMNFPDCSYRHPSPDPAGTAPRFRLFCPHGGIF